MVLAALAAVAVGLPVTQQAFLLRVLAALAAVAVGLALMHPLVRVVLAASVAGVVVRVVGPVVAITLEGPEAMAL